MRFFNPQGELDEKRAVSGNFQDASTLTLCEEQKRRRDHDKELEFLYRRTRTGILVYFFSPRAYLIL